MAIAKNTIEIGKRKIFFAGGEWRLAKTKVKLVNAKYFSPAENGDWQKQNIFRQRRVANGKRKSEIGKIKNEITKIKNEIAKNKIEITKNKSEIGNFTGVFGHLRRQIAGQKSDLTQ